MFVRFCPFQQNPTFTLNVRHQTLIVMAVSVCPFNSCMTSGAFSLQLSTAFDMVLCRVQGETLVAPYTFTLHHGQHVVCQTVLAEGDNGLPTHLASDISSTISRLEGLHAKSAKAVPAWRGYLSVQ